MRPCVHVCIILSYIEILGILISQAQIHPIPHVSVKARFSRKPHEVGTRNTSGYKSMERSVAFMQLCVFLWKWASPHTVHPLFLRNGDSTTSLDKYVAGLYVG